MEVILQENYPALGYVGERVKVKRGYARNYLIPRGIAVEAGSGNAKELKHRLSMIALKKERLLQDAKKSAKALEGLILEFTLVMGGSGKAFGSVTIKDIEDSLKQKGHSIERKQIRLLEPFRSAGEYPLEIRLHSELSASITIRVLTDKPQSQTKSVEDATPKAQRRQRKEEEF